MVVPENDSGEEAVRSTMATISRKYSPQDGSWLNLDPDRIMYELGWTENMANLKIIEAALDALEEESKT